MQGSPGQILSGSFISAAIARPVVFVSLTCALLLLSCQKSASDSSETNYPHPSSTTSGMTNVPVATLKSVAKAVSATADTILTVGKTSVTIPAGTIGIAATASLTSYGGVFINNANLTLESEPLLLKIIDMSGNDLTRAHIAKDMIVEIESAGKVTASKLAVLIHENGGLDSATKTGIKQSTLTTMLSATNDGRYKATFKIRPPRIAMVLATTGGGLPNGYDAFVPPPSDVTNLTTTVNSPSQITLAWQADATNDQGFAVVSSSGLSTPTACASSDVVAATLDSTTNTYSYILAGLNDGTSFTFRVCATSFRDPVDMSPGLNVTATTPARAAAVLTNAPAASSNLAALDVTVGGNDIVDYRYALLTNANSCSNATYSSAIPVATKITDSLPSSGTMILCVLGRISSSNEQLVPTTATWTMDTTAPVFVSISLANDASDSRINIIETANTTAVVGALAATGHDGAKYALTLAANVCNGALTYVTAIPQSNAMVSLAEGSYKVCVQLYDLAGNVAYGSSPDITLDLTAPVFASLSLANDAIDGYLNNAEKSLTNALTGGAAGTGFTVANYALTTSATTCNGSLTYSSTIPKNNDTGISADGVYKVCAQIKDDAGNTAYGSSATITRKTTLPTVTALARGSDVTDGYLSIAEAALTNPLAGAITGSNYDTAAYAVVTSATTCNSSVTYGAMPNTHSTVINTNNQNYKVCVKVSDTANNPAAYGASSTFLALIANPTCTGVALSGDALDGYINSTEFTHSTAISTGTSGNGATVATKNYVVIASGVTCNGALTFSTTLPKANDPAFAVSGTYKICSRVADMVSQYGYCSSSTITSTQSTITFSSINLAGPAADGYISQADHSLSTAIVSGLSGANYSTAKYVVASSASTCNGSLTYSASIPGANHTNISVDGTTYKVCVQLTDAAGNTPAYGASGIFMYDATAPVFTSLSLGNDASDTYINAAEHSLTTAVATTLSATGYDTAQYVLVSSSTTCALPLSWASSIPKADDANFSADGSYKVCVQLADAAGNLTYGSTVSINFDTVAPTFSSLSLINDAADGYLNASDVTLSQDVAGSLVSSGATSTNFTAVSSTASCSAQSSWSTSVPVGTDFSALTGTFKICAKLSDDAGNLSYGATTNFVIDRSAPSFSSVALSQDAVDGFINTAERSLNHPLVSAAVGSGYDTIQYALVADATPCASVGTWAATIPSSDSVDFGSDGNYKVCVMMTDNAGNVPDFGSSAPFTLDTVSPTFTALSLGSDAADGALNQVERTHSTSIIGALVAAGHTTSAYKVVSSGTACSGSLTYGADESANTSSIGTDGSYKICVRLADSADNRTYESSSTFDVDTATPTFTSLALGAAVLDGYLTVAEHAGATSLGGSLTASGQTSSAYALSLSTTTCNASVTYGGMPNSDDGTLANATSFKICVAITDASGNTSYGSSANFVTDFTAPNISSVSLGNVVSDTYLNLSDHQGSLALVNSVVASGQDTLSYAVASSLASCNGSLAYSATIPKSDDAAMSADGSWKVCVKASDTAGNPDSYLGSSTFTRDVTKPTSTLTTNGSVTPDSTAGSTTIIAGSASDAATGVAAVVISIQEGSGLCYDDAAIDFSAACPHWIAVSGTTNWSQSLDDSSFLKGQLYTVSTQATDVAGNVQSSYGSNTFTFTAGEGLNLWNRELTYDGSGDDDRALAGVSDASGNLYVAGYHTNGDKNWLIKKFSKRGVEDTTNWNKDVGDSGVDEIARSINVDSTGNVYVVGSRFNGSDLDWMIKKYSSSGVEDTANWDMLIDSGFGDDEALGVVTDSAGNVFVVGYGRNLAGAATGDDLWIKKFTGSGVLACEQKLDEGGANLSDRLTAVAINNATAKLYVAGYKTVTGPDQQWVVKRLRTSDCSVESTATGNSAGVGDYATAVRVDNAGNVIVTGVNSVSGQDWWIRKYSAALALSGEYNPAAGGIQRPQGLAIDSANRIYVGGFKTNASQDSWVRQFSSSVTENLPAWNQISDGAGAADQISAVLTSTGINNTDQIYVIGWSTNKVSGASGADWWIRKLAGP